jgi:hypothetical protein
MPTVIHQPEWLSLSSQRSPRSGGPRPPVLTWRSLRVPATLVVCAVVVASALVGLTGRSSAAQPPAGTPGGPGGPQPGTGLLPATIAIPPIVLPLPGVPPLQLPALSLPALPPLIGGSAAPGIPAGLNAYRGLAGWVDLYHYGAPGDAAPAQTVAEMASRGVRTVYIETARWNSAGDLDFPGALGLFIDAAHAGGMAVIGWYLPGFAGTGTDLRRSLAALQFTSPGGGHLDGFAADIEDHGATSTLGQFNAGIVAYADALRAAVPAGTVLGAIVPDARNNERAPAHWAGFPWPQIGSAFDVILPMAYWSVTKAPASCLETQMDVTGYITQVVTTTEALMGQSKPIAPMGGIANCDTVQEVAEYVGTLRTEGALGGGLYDFETLQTRPDANAIWSELAGLNG